MKPGTIFLFVLLVLGMGACNLPVNAPDAGETTNSPRPTITTGPIPTGLVSPADFEYLGAFRLPDDGDRPYTFEYGGNAMTFNPGGDPTGPDDGFPGSLFISGHDRLPYGELPDGGQVAEVDIPVPTRTGDVTALNTAGFLQGFANVTDGFFTGLDEIPRLGLAYLDTPATGPLLHITWGQHLQFDLGTPTHAWFSTDLSNPDMQGEWYIDDLSPYSVTGYLFTIPANWAETHTDGQQLATGRYRDGGWSGMGPSLVAYQPWVDENGTPAADGTHLDATVLLLYESSENTAAIEHAMTGYQHPDEWEGGAWVVTPSGKTAVLFAGTKSLGEKYWYGWVNPDGPQAACVETEMLGEFTLCYQADGTPCPQSDLGGCSGHNDYRGWWSDRFEAEIILYDPADLAKVATGEMESWEPQPYAVLSLEDVLFHNPSGVDADMLGTGDQRRFRIGDVAYDPVNGLLYVLELYADGAKPVVHVWRIK